MLQTFNLTPTHSTFLLNRQIYYFLLKIRNVPTGTSFNPYQQYFSTTFAAKVAVSPTLRARINSFFDAFVALNIPQRNAFIDKFKLSQNIEFIVENISFNGNDIKLSALPVTIRTQTTDLFNYLYESVLPSYGKKEHYKLLYDQVESTVCPFCGIEKLGDPDFRCQDYDHILYKATYPLGAVNMRNLIPMGIECNRTHKKTTDVLYGENHRRKFIYSYQKSQIIEVSLEGSTLPLAGRKAVWNVKLLPNNGYTRTWNRVFEIKKRYRKTELQKYFDIWIKLFKHYLKSDRGIVWDANSLKNEFARMGESYVNNPLDTSNIIKGAVFLFIANSADQAFIQATVNELNS
jgi:hypothetical protein